MIQSQLPFESIHTCMCYNLLSYFSKSTQIMLDFENDVRSEFRKQQRRIPLSRESGWIPFFSQ